MVGKNRVRQSRGKRVKNQDVPKSYEGHYEQEVKELYKDDAPRKLQKEPLVKQATASTIDNHFNIKEEYDDAESNMYESSICEYSQKESSVKRKETAMTEPLWRYYPKQVQNILKKKRIDRERLRRSLKPPGKRNYKVLFANIKTVSKDEVSKTSRMFKGMKDDYYRLINAEKKVYRALQQKGLFLDKQDFNIMEVFNSRYSDYSESENEDNNTFNHKREKHDSIYVEDFESTSAKHRKRGSQNEDISDRNCHMYSNGSIKRPQDQSSLDIPSVGNSGTPISQGFEKFSIISKNSHKSHHTFVSKSSHRMLFQDYKVEKRPQKEFPQPCHPKKDFLCTWNSPAVYYPVVELNPYLASDDESEESVLVDSQLMRSFSMPAPPHNELDSKLIEPLVLERQPFSNLINFSKANHAYANPLDKVDLKQAFKNEAPCGDYSQPRFLERNYVEDSFDFDEDENIHL